VDETAYSPLRPPVLGFQLEADAPHERFRLVEVLPGRVHCEGDLDACQARLAELLASRWGLGLPNLELKTPGGLQLWGDEFWCSGWRIQEHVYTGHARLLDPHDVRRAWGSRQACRAAFEALRASEHIPPPAGELVVLLHGLGRTRASLARLEQALARAGYTTAALSYPSTRRSLAEHADQLLRLLDQLEGVQRISFVTHSLGGIVVRAALARPASWRQRIGLGRIVMLAPPSRGSALAQQLADFLPAQLVLGPSAHDLAADEIAAIPAPPCPFGVVAAGSGGARGINPLLPGDNDGILAVEETRLAGADDFLLVPGLHTFLMNDEQVIAATLRFLACGRFADEAAR